MREGRRTEVKTRKGLREREEVVRGRKQVACMGRPAGERS